MSKLRLLRRRCVIVPLFSTSSLSLPLSLAHSNLASAAATAALLLFAAATPQNALARDAKAAAAAAAERKAALRAAAAASRESGKDGADSAFGDSDYSVGEDHTTPNSHSHQSEGARTSGGD